MYVTLDQDQFRYREAIDSQGLSVVCINRLCREGRTLVAGDYPTLGRMCEIEVGPTGQLVETYERSFIPILVRS